LGKNIKDSEYLKLGQKIPTKEKLCFGLGILANTILSGIVALYLTDYYINEIKIKYELFILANFIFLFYNALNDVFFGYYSDRTKHKLGRRIPYIRYGAPIFALAFIYFWIPLPGTYPGDLNRGQWLKFFQLLTAYLFFDTMLTIVILSIVALPPEMSESTEERSSIALYNAIFGAIGGVSIFIVPIIMSLGLDIFRLFIFIMAGIATCAYIILSYGVKERRELHEGAEEKEDEYTLWREITQTLRNRTFISFLIFNFCIVYISTMILAFTPFFTNLFGFERDQTTLILLLSFLGNAIFLPLFIYFSKKVEIRTIILITSFFCLIVIFTLLIIDLIYDVVEIYFGILIFDGIIFGMSLFYYPFISDAIDIDELNTDRRREGMHFGMNALITKPAEQLPLMVGAFILLLTSYNQGGSAADQPISAINGLKFMVAVIPTILLVIIIFSQLINPCKKKYIKDIKEKIMELHQEKKKLIKKREKTYKNEEFEK